MPTPGKKPVSAIAVWGECNALPTGIGGGLSRLETLWWMAEGWSTKGHQ